MQKGGDPQKIPRPRKTTEDRNELDLAMQKAAEDLPWWERREWIRRVNLTSKAILLAVLGWMVDQIRDHTARTAVAASLTLVAAGTTQVATNPSVGAPTHAQPVVMIAAPTPTTEQRLAPAPPAPTPAITTTVTLAPTQAPTRDDQPRPTATVTVPTEPRESELVVSASPPDADATPEPTETPTWRIPERDYQLTPPPITPTPTDKPEPTTAPPGTLNPTRTPESTPEPACTPLPERVGVSGTVCAPPIEVDQDRRWTECLDLERAIHILRCLRNPDGWFT